MLLAAIVVIALTLKLMTALTCKRKDKHNYLTVQTQGYNKIASSALYSIYGTNQMHTYQKPRPTRCTITIKSLIVVLH